MTCSCCGDYGHHHRTFDAPGGKKGEEFACKYCGGEPRKDCKECK